MSKSFKIIVGMMLASGATAAAADVLVVRATGPSATKFPAGRSLADNARITLVANDALVVLDSRGTRTLRGPGTFSPGQAAPTQPQRVAAATPQRRARIGAVRSVGAAPATARPTSLWALDVAKSSTVCLAGAPALSLWRADTSRPTTVTLTRTGDGAKESVQWNAGQASLGWPTTLAPRDGAEYRVSWTGGGAPTTYRFKSVGTMPMAPEQTARTLIENGCTAQLDVLIEATKVPEETAVPA